MKKIIRDYFSFNKRERNGVFILLSIIIFEILYLAIWPSYVAPSEVQVVELPPEARQKKDSVPMIRSKRFQKKESGKIDRFDFDPNHLSDNDWQRLGLSARQIKMIRNFENKGGTFRKKEDLKKMYCISTELYRSLEQYIHIEENNVQYLKPDKENSRQKIPEGKAVIELNTADSASLTMLKGIGPYFAKSIIKYRNSVGGFYKKEQLKEVWRFDEEKYLAIEANIKVDPALIRKININTCEPAQLKTAYISWNIANGIVNYRKKHGPYKSVEDIRLTDLVDEETYIKIAPYLTIDDL